MSDSEAQCVTGPLIFKTSSLNPYIPEVLFMGPRQTE